MNVCDVHESHNETGILVTTLLFHIVTQQIKTEKKCRQGLGWFYPSVVDWMEAERLNISLHAILRKCWGSSRLNDWKSLAYVTREKSIVLLEDTFLHYDVKCEKTWYMHGWFVHNNINNMHIENRYGELTFHANFKVEEKSGMTEMQADVWQLVQRSEVCRKPESVLTVSLQNTRQPKKQAANTV